MTITKRVQKELVQAVPPEDNQLLKTLRKNSRASRAAHKARSTAEKNKGKTWTSEEHSRFLVALDVFPSGPWKAIADYVGTKDSRQTMTHAQKYRQKHERQQRGLRNRNKINKTKIQTADPSTSETQTTNDAEPQSMTDVAVHENVALEFDVTMNEVAEFPGFSEPPPTQTLMKQLSDSPRSADEGVHAVNSNPFAPVVADDLMFTLALDASAAWISAKSDSNLMEIFADFNERVVDTEWPQMWSTNSLEEIVASCSQFDFLGEGAH